MVCSLLFVVIGCSFSANEQNSVNLTDKTSKVLIIYFSLYENMDNSQYLDTSTSASVVATEDNLVGTTEYVAKQIQAFTNGDLFSIKVKNKYSSNYQDIVDKNHQEQDESAYPEIEDMNVTLDGYDTVFIGYPVWATTIPRVIVTFLESYDLSQKKIVPFCTHNGYGAGDSFEEIQEYTGSDRVLEGLSIQSDDVISSNDEIKSWLNSISFN